MKPSVLAALIGIAPLSFTGPSLAQSAVPVQLRWQAPANCPQEAQVRQKLRELLGANAGGPTSSRLRAEGQIEPVGDRFRLTLNIHYDLVNGTRVVQAGACEDLGGVAAVTLALLFRAEHGSSAPLTARDLGGATSGALGDARTSGAESQSATAPSQSTNAGTPPLGQGATAGDAKPSSVAPSSAEKPESNQQSAANQARGSDAMSWRFVLSAPELRTDIGVLPHASYGLGLGAGVRHGAWRLVASAAWWLAQDYQAGPFVGYGAHFNRLSAELSACHGFRVGEFELAPCALVSVNDVSARGTGVSIASTNPRTAWLSAGAGFLGAWSLGRRAAVVFGINGLIATSKPRFELESVGEVYQVGPAALGVMLGGQWLLGS